MHQEPREQDQPAPHGPFDHPALGLTLHEVSHHSPGFEEPGEPAAAAATATPEDAGARMPPRAGSERPRAGLAERVLQHLASGESSR